LADRDAVFGPIADALDAEMAHLNITIHVEPREKAKQHAIPAF
jgi:hypothetical protein